MIHVNRAIVFGVTDDQERVWERRAYAKRRGYRLVAVLDDWDTVLRLVGERKASIIIFVNRDARRLPADDGETTRDLSAITSARASMRNGFWPALVPRLLPGGDDGGFAERFLRDRRRSRHISDT